jgi:hypothetical protein
MPPKKTDQFSATNDRPIGRSPTDSPPTDSPPTDSPQNDNPQNASSKKGSRGSKVKASALESAIAAIGNIPEKPQEFFSLREAIVQLLPYITTALEKGYSIEEIADYLARDGIVIQPSTLRSYLVAARRASGTKRKIPRRRTS